MVKLWQIWPMGAPSTWLSRPLGVFPGASSPRPPNSPRSRGSFQGKMLRVSNQDLDVIVFTGVCLCWRVCVYTVPLLALGALSSWPPCPDTAPVVLDGVLAFWQAYFVCPGPGPESAISPRSSCSFPGEKHLEIFIWALGGWGGCSLLFSYFQAFSVATAILKKENRSLS